MYVSYNEYILSVFLLYFTAFDIKLYVSTIWTFWWEFLREVDGSGILKYFSLVVMVFKSREFCEQKSFRIRLPSASLKKF